MLGREQHHGRTVESGLRRLDASDLSGVEAVDTDGRALLLVTEPTAHPPVAQRLIELDGCSVSLEVLAASHRVRLLSSTGREAATETVACDDRPLPSMAGGHLPPHHTWTSAGWRLSFQSQLRTGTTTVDAAADELARFAGDDKTLIRRFPGHELAITALRAIDDGPDRVAWRSWHLYPGPDSHVVFTETRAIQEESRP